MGWPYREYIKTAKNGSFCEELLSENDFEAVLANFCCHDYVANASVAVQKNATDQNNSHKCYSCDSFLNSENISINNSEKRFATRVPPT